MREHHLDLSLSADRCRADRPVASSSRAVSRPAASPRPQAALTKREQKVKELLLQELKKLNRYERGERLSYNEKKKLEQRLDVAFLDSELVKLRKKLRQTERWLPLAFAAGAICAIAVAVAFTMGETSGFFWGYLFAVPFQIWGYYRQRQALQRKIFIYEALRELSDADELDVVLDESTRQADLLIEKLVAQDLAWEAAHAPLRRLRN